MVQQVYSDDTKSVVVPVEQLPQFADPDSKDLTGVVRIKGLADPHLLRPASRWPTRWTTRQGAADADGTVTLAADPSKDETYTTRVYAPDPTPKELADASTDYPTDVRRGIEIGGVAIPPGDRRAEVGDGADRPVVPRGRASRLEALGRRDREDAVPGGDRRRGVLP